MAKESTDKATNKYTAKPRKYVRCGGDGTPEGSADAAWPYINKSVLAELMHAFSVVRSQETAEPEPATASTKADR